MAQSSTKINAAIPFSHHLILLFKVISPIFYDDKVSEGSEGKVDGAFGPEGCIKGLYPQRGNDSLHFMRRYRSYKMCSLCIAGAQGMAAAPLLRVVDCRLWRQ